jgi:hypothetical protein
MQDMRGLRAGSSSAWGHKTNFPLVTALNLGHLCPLIEFLVHEISLYCLRFDANSSPKFRYQDLIYLDVYRQVVTNWAEKIKVWREGMVIVPHLSGNSLSRNRTPPYALYKALVLSVWRTDEAGDKSSPHPCQQYRKFVCVSFGTNLTNTPSSCRLWLQSCGGRRTPIKQFFVPSSQNTLQIISYKLNTCLDRLRLINSRKLWCHSAIGGSN